jgi:hypothetical protein
MRQEMKAEVIKAVKDSRKNPPVIMDMLDFVREEGVANSTTMTQKFGNSFVGGTRSRFHVAVKASEGFQMIVGQNRYLPSYYFYDDGTKRPPPQLWAFRLHAFMKAKQPAKQSMNRTEINDWILPLVDGDGDYAKKITDAILSPKSDIREQFKTLFEWQIGSPCASLRRK